MPAQSYGLGADPRPLGIRSTKFRADVDPINIHHDPRISRGNTFSSDKRSEIPGPTSTKARRRNVSPKDRSKEILAQERTLTAVTLFDRYQGSKAQREELDLTRFLVEPGEGEKPSECDEGTQTNEFEDRPPTPPYVPRKTGVDACTQIEQSDGLFIFNEEVQPLLDVLVGKTLEQARLEVEHEYELECILEEAVILNRAREEDEERIRVTEKAEVEAERREMDLRCQARDRAAAKQDVTAKVACAQLMEQLFPLILDGAMSDLCANSWTTPTVKQIRSGFLPWLYSTVEEVTDRRAAVDGVIASLYTTAIREADAKATARELDIQQRRFALAALRHRQAAIIRLFVRGEVLGRSDGQEKLGPILVQAGETIVDAEAAIGAWVLENELVEGDVEAPEGGFFGAYLQGALGTDQGEVEGVFGPETTLLEVQDRKGVVETDVVLW